MAAVLAIACPMAMGQGILDVNMSPGGQGTLGWTASDGTTEIWDAADDDGDGRESFPVPNLSAAYGCIEWSNGAHLCWCTGVSVDPIPPGGVKIPALLSVDGVMLLTLSDAIILDDSGGPPDPGTLIDFSEGISPDLPAVMVKVAPDDLTTEQLLDAAFVKGLPAYSGGAIVEDAGTYSADETAREIVDAYPPGGEVVAPCPCPNLPLEPFEPWTFSLTFDGDMSAAGMEDFLVSEEGGDGVPPEIIEMTVSGATVALTLAIDMTADADVDGFWFTITHVPSGSSATYGRLPADVNGDGTSGPTDLLTLIDSLNGVVELEMWSGDVDRSGLIAAADVLKEIDLLNGAGDYIVYNGVSLP